jgi:pilus assembly protein CpaF
MAVTFDPDGFGPAIPWAGAELVDAAVVRRLRTRVATELADAQADRERRGQARLADEDEREYGIELINDALEHHALDLITRGIGPPTAEEEEALHRAVFNLLFGLGRLQPHLDQRRADHPWHARRRFR